MRPLFKAVLFAAVGILAVSALFVGRSYIGGSGHRSKGDGEQAAAGAAARNVVVLVSPIEPYATFGRSAVLGAQAAAKVLNARAAQSSGADKSQPITFHVRQYVMQSASSHDIAAELTDALPLADVDLLLIADDESRTRAAMHAALQLKIPIVYLMDGPCKTIASGKDPSPYLWGAGFGLETIVEPLLISVSDKLSVPDKDLSIIFVGGDNESDRRIIGFTRKSADDLGFKVIDSRFTDMRITDFYTFIRDIFASAPNVLFVSNPSHSGVLFLQQAGKLSVAKEMTVVGLNSFDAEFLGAIGSSSEDALTIGRYSPGIRSKENEEFLSAFKEQIRPETPAADATPAPAAPAVPTETALGGYVSLLVVDKAMHSAGAGDRKAWISKLPQTEVAGPMGRIYADEDNHVFHQNLFILKIHDGVHVVVDSIGESSHPRKERCELGQ